MKLKPIINSLLVNDLYKFSMQNVVLHQFPSYKTTWKFKCRNKGIEFTPEMIEEIEAQIDYYCTLKFTEEELEWLAKSFPWLKEDYIDYLRLWHPRRNEIHINDIISDDEECGLCIEATGTWLSTSFYEMPILSICNEVYFAFRDGVGAHDIEFQKATMEKFDKIKSGEYDIGTFSEFGLRRRYSADMQDWVIKYIVDQKIPGFVGTSNVYLAKKYGVKATGTCAHEMAMALMTDNKFNPAYVNSRLMEAWVKEYGVQNGIFLTDVIGRAPFLADFNVTYATLFSGVRHDSGDPIAWGEDMIAHYKKLGIDPMTKTLLFSDALDFEKATKIKKHFEGRAKVAFGIGTYISGIQDGTALNIVMKVAECNGFPTCKITDNPSKAMGDKNFIDYVKRCIDWRMKYEEN